MNTYERFLQDEDATVQLGRDVSRCLSGRGLVFLIGDLGAGKTTFSRGILRELGHQGAVKSPTFTLVEPYDMTAVTGGQVYHFDLYRLNEPDELEYIGIDDYFAGENLCLVEWPEKADEQLPPPDLILNLTLQGRSRHATLTACTAHGQQVLKLLQA